jgi:hypothetical protein
VYGVAEVNPSGSRSVDFSAGNRVNSDTESRTSLMNGDEKIERLEDGRDILRQASTEAFSQSTVAALPSPFSSDVCGHTPENEHRNDGNPRHDCYRILDGLLRLLATSGQRTRGLEVDIKRFRRAL